MNALDQKALEAAQWRCFHCDEVFTDERSARLHFGDDETQTPACKIKGAEGGLVEALRRAEKDAADAWHAIHAETTDAAKAYHAQAARHQEQIRALEQVGYDRGIADAKAFPETLGLAVAEAVEPVAWHPASEKPVAISVLARSYDNDLVDWVYSVFDPPQFYLLTQYTEWLPLGALDGPLYASPPSPASSPKREKAVPPKLVDGLNEVVNTAYKDSYGDWHITADEGRVRKLCKAAIAALSPDLAVKGDETKPEEREPFEPKFKAGDRVVRVSGGEWIGMDVGDIGVVSKVIPTHNNWCHLRIEGYSGLYSDFRYQPAPPLPTGEA